jgi:hypothetical protein
MVASQFSSGLWTALFCAPLPVLLAQGGAKDREDMRRCLFATNLAVSALAFFLFWAIGQSVGLQLPEALLFAGFAMINLLRWFARAYAYAEGGGFRTMFSDLAFSFSLMGSIYLISLNPEHVLVLTYAALCLSAILSLLPFGPRYLAQQFLHFTFKDLPPYAAVWKRHSAWSLTGVLTTEATVNSHAYILTFFAGPGAFAPIAASALMIRPVGVAINALTEFERPQIARQIGKGDMTGAFKSVRFFRMIMILAWIVTAIGGTVLVMRAPHLVFPSTYDPAFLITGTILWMAVAGMRQLRGPESVLLQAGGEFRVLAYASMISSGISIIAVVGFLLTLGPLWSIAGIFIGESVFAAITWRQAADYRRRSTQAVSAEVAAPPLP